MPFRFVHAADLHLDTPFRRLLPMPPVVADTLRDASLRAFAALVDLAIQRDAAFVLLAGDVYDGPERGIRAQVAVRDGLERLSSAGIRAFLVHGNHDPVETGWSAIPRFPEGVTLFGAEEVGAVPVERHGEVVATVHGISFTARQVEENLVRQFHRGDQPGFHIGMLHCEVTDGLADVGPPPVSPGSLADLERTGMDYWALGYRHDRQVLRHGDPWVVYPGTIQARKPSERGARGALVVEVDAGVAKAPEFVALDQVRLAEVEMDVSGLRDLIDVRQALQGSADDLVREAGGRPLVVQGRLTGSGPAAEEIRRGGATVELLQSLRDEAGLDDPFLWWDRVEDRTRTDLDLDALRARADFPAEVLAMATELAADPEHLRVFAERHLTPLRAPALARVRAEVDDPADARRWQETVELSLSALAAVER